ncbi:MAG TPA: hypothetical protein DEH02_04305 [Bacteroidales bacterium]|nr:MAG: hypothetical protein A2491_03030 [Bacteroidetes bacterium RIFOXYC12_FULL_35_7]HBX50277.1 hypothetical protein [Bacteroidales bacterium]
MKKILLIFFAACLLQSTLFAPKAKAQVNVQDSLALMKFYYSTNGQNWTTPWDTTQAISNWTGVVIDSNRIVQLNLWNKNLFGIIPPEIGNLSELTHLNLNNNFLTGSLPTNIGSLHKLTGLDISKNQISGTLPDEIGNLDSLGSLRIYDNQFSGSIPNAIGNLYHLTDFEAYHNQFTNLPSLIGNLQNISLLTIGDNLLDSLPTEINNLILLDIFDCRNNNLSWVPVKAMYACNISGNRLTFENIEPLKSICIYFDYIPQDSVLYEIDTTINLGLNFSISSLIGGSTNHYLWYKNGIPLSNETLPELDLQNISFMDSGTYTCRISNDIVTDLTLWRHLIKVHVKDTLQNVIQNPLILNEIQILVKRKNITIEIPLASETRGYSLSVFNTFGIEIIKKNITCGTHEINIESQGIYFIQVKCDKEIITEKILIN